MTKSEKQWWEQERTKGRERFLLKYGLLRAGLSFGVLLTAGKLLYSFFAHKATASVWRLLVEFGIYVLGFGAILGVWAWQNKERDYKRPTEDDDVV